MVRAESDNRRGEDRRRSRRLTYPDRRTGFDRRMPDGGRTRTAYEAMLRRYRENDRTIFLVLVILTVLNLADLLYTQRALVRGAVEVNPVMRFFFDIHPVWAAVVKASIGVIVAEVIWVFRRHRSALVLSVFATLAMAALFAYHLITQKIVPI
jgi:hypothetical protein